LSICINTLALKTEWTSPLCIDFCFWGMIHSTKQIKDSHWFLCNESPTNSNLFPWSFLRANIGLKLQQKNKNFHFSIHLNHPNKHINKTSWYQKLPWQGTIFWLPLPMLIIRIISTIFYTRKLSIYIWTSYVSVDRLYWLVKNPFSIGNVAFFWVKFKSVINPCCIYNLLINFLITC
jgi:hypothetical protein